MRHLTDTQIHELERVRLQFKHHVIVFLIANAILWATWYLSGSGYMWPIWPTCLWSVVVIFHYMEAWAE